MGINSNRNLTKPERIGEYIKEISRAKDTSDFDWQITVGAKIRGDLGVKKGNAFIKATKVILRNHE